MVCHTDFFSHRKIAGRGTCVYKDSRFRICVGAARFDFQPNLHGPKPKFLLGRHDLVFPRSHSFWLLDTGTGTRPLLLHNRYPPLSSATGVLRLLWWRGSTRRVRRAAARIARRRTSGLCGRVVGTFASLCC